MINGMNFMDKFKQQYPIIVDDIVRWGDMDAFGHVNNTVYFRYFEQARIGYFDQIKAMEYMQTHGIGPILAATNCRFKAPLKSPDTIQVGATVSEFSEHKLIMKYAVWSNTLQRVVAEGEGVIVFVDYREHKKMPVPADIVDKIKQLQPVLFTV
jgi:acyl-CoA thioester hydrolase